MSSYGQIPFRSPVVPALLRRTTGRLGYQGDCACLPCSPHSLFPPPKSYYTTIIETVGIVGLTPWPVSRFGYPTLVGLGSYNDPTWTEAYPQKCFLGCVTTGSWTGASGGTRTITEYEPAQNYFVQSGTAPNYLYAAPGGYTKTQDFANGLDVFFGPEFIAAVEAATGVPYVEGTYLNVWSPTPTTIVTPERVYIQTTYYTYLDEVVGSLIGTLTKEVVCSNGVSYLEAMAAAATLVGDFDWEAIQDSALNNGQVNAQTYDVEWSYTYYLVRIQDGTVAVVNNSLGTGAGQIPTPTWPAGTGTLLAANGFWESARSRFAAAGSVNYKYVTVNNTVYDQGSYNVNYLNTDPTLAGNSTASGFQETVSWSAQSVYMPGTVPGVGLLCTALPG